MGSIQSKGLNGLRGGNFKFCIRPSWPAKNGNGNHEWTTQRHRQESMKIPKG